MNYLGSYETFDDAYRLLIDYVHAEGFWCTPRGHACKELRPASFTIKDATRMTYTGNERKLNYRLVMLETLSYVSGVCNTNTTNMICTVNPNMVQFVNKNTNVFQGAYGPRLAHGLEKAYNALTEDPWTRQAVASVWNNEEDRVTVDLPCTLSFHFFAVPIMDGDDMIDKRLDMHVYMRSNDLNWGTPYDLAAFGEIQCMMARALGMKPGQYHHTAGSLHFYRDAMPTVDLTPAHNDRTKIAIKDELFVSNKTSNVASWSLVVYECRRLLEALFNAYYGTEYFRPTVPGETWEDKHRKLAYDNWSDPVVRLWRQANYKR